MVIVGAIVSMPANDGVRRQRHRFLAILSCVRSKICGEKGVCGLVAKGRAMRSCGYPPVLSFEWCWRPQLAHPQVHGEAIRPVRRYEIWCRRCTSETEPTQLVRADRPFRRPKIWLTDILNINVSVWLYGFLMRTHSHRMLTGR